MDFSLLLHLLLEVSSIQWLWLAPGCCRRLQSVLPSLISLLWSKRFLRHLIFNMSAKKFKVSLPSLAQ